MVARPSPLPESLKGRAFGIQEAHHAGLSPSRVRGRDLDRPFAGVRVAPGEDEPAPQHPVVTLARIYALKMGPAEFFSHSTAAVIYGMWLPLDLEQSTLLHVSVRKPARAPRDRGVKGHHLVDRPGLVVEHDGVRLASPLETWCQLATQLHIPDLVAAGDSLLTPDHRETAVMLDRLVGAAADGDRPMSIRLERAVRLIRRNVRSAKESELRLLLLAAGLPEPEINGTIVDEQGRFVAECDLVYRGANVVLEYEGDGHRDRARFRKDITRYDRLQDLGWRVIRVTQEDLNHPADLLARVRRALGL
jgi:very-short-patch-repair endonuclease